MAIQLYSPTAGAVVENPVVISWEANGTDNAWYHLGSWIEFDASEYSCTNTTCTATLTLEYESNYALRIWQDGEQTTTTSFSTGAEGVTGGTGEVVVVLDTTQLKAMLDEYFVVDADLTGTIVGQTIVLFALGFGAAKVARLLAKR